MAAKNLLTNTSDYSWRAFQQPPSAGDFFTFLARFHGHRCPMSIMGARMGLAARAVVGYHREDGGGDVRAIYHHKTCAVDGVMAALGTTLGNNNLQLLPEGEHLLEARNLATGVAVKVELAPQALELGRRYSTLKRSNTSTPEELEAILLELEKATDEEVVILTRLEGDK
jgi:formylmethanofuran dehydrogenase subunit E